jgi:hypothetical protein
MRRFLDSLPPRLRSLTYSEVEDDVDRLGARLLKTLGEDGVAAATFVGIPRGGVIVLGMLAYTLGLHPSQLTRETGSSGVLVVVDDGAYTGARIAEFIADLDGDPDIVVAVLMAPPPLLEAIEQHEDRVIACMAADHTEDLTSAADRSHWPADWTALLHQRRRYWVGETEYVCFPWGEPSWTYWDTVSQEARHGWSIMPPHVCLEHRPDTGRAPLPVDIQERGPGPLHPEPDIMYASLDDAVLLTTIEGDRRFVLEGVAADMWRMLLARGDVNAAVEPLLALYEVEEDILRNDLSAFVGDLTEAGLLRRDQP